MYLKYKYLVPVQFYIQNGGSDRVKGINQTEIEIHNYEDIVNYDLWDTEYADLTDHFMKTDHPINKFLFKMSDDDKQFTIKKLELLNKGLNRIKNALITDLPVKYKITYEENTNNIINEQYLPDPVGKLIEISINDNILLNNFIQGNKPIKDILLNSKNHEIYRKHCQQPCNFILPNKIKNTMIMFEQNTNFINKIYEKYRKVNELEKKISSLHWN